MSTLRHRISLMRPVAAGKRRAAAPRPAAAGPAQTPAQRGGLLATRALLESRGVAANSILQRLAVMAQSDATLHRDDAEAPVVADPTLLSGAHWRTKANDMGWNDITSLDELAEPFQTNAVRFIGALQEGGATVQISTTKRYIERAWLMHNAWVVAHGGAAPKDDPYGTGIVWDHGSATATKQAAKEMIGRSGFNMAFDASMHSRHFSGNAIDITISGLPEEWTFTYAEREVTVKIGTEDPPDNRRLHRAAEKYFGVKKLLGDRPHWSDNGH